jgi:hypothetical protein
MINIDTHPDILLWMIQEQQRTLWKETERRMLWRQATADSPRSYRRTLLALLSSLRSRYARKHQGHTDAGGIRPHRQRQEESTLQDISTEMQTMFFQEPPQTHEEDVCTAAASCTRVAP